MNDIDWAATLAQARADDAAAAAGETPSPFIMPTPESEHADRVARRLRFLRAERDARAQLAAEGRTVEPFDAGTLAEVLARPAEPRARVASLVPWEAGTLIVAQRKTGKTTLTLNLARSLITGEPFLGSLAVRPIQPGARVALLNFEVSAAQLAAWAREHRVDPDALFLVNLRGRRNPLTHADDRERLADLLREKRAESLMVDPFGRAYSGASQNDAGEVGAFLVGLDQFARADVGARDLFLTAHAGWNGERTRGSSALEDWADSIVTMTKDEDTDARFIRATGRDVELDEDRLAFDPDTRALSLTGDGSRKAAGATRRDAETIAAIVDILEEHPEGMSGEQLGAAAHRKDAAFTSVRDALVSRGVLTADKRRGRGGGKVYTLTSTQPPEPPENPPTRDLLNPPNPPLVPGGSDRGGYDANPPRLRTTDEARP